MSVATYLKESPLGAGLSDQQVETLAGLASLNRLADGQFLIREGDNDDSLHLLVSGKLDVVKKAPMGDDISLHVLREGDLAGELSFIDGEKHTLSLRALSDSEVVSLKREDFKGLIGSDPDLMYKVMCSIMRSVHRILHRMNHQHIELSNYISKQHGRY